MPNLISHLGKYLSVLRPRLTWHRKSAFDPAEQLRAVIGASFEKRRLLTKTEARMLYAAEDAIKEARLNWRVMAQVSLGEVVWSPDSRAYAAINSKRVDLLVISNTGIPIAAIEYQGKGHHQGMAAARDAVKKEALRIAGVRYIEMTHGHTPADLKREIAQAKEARRAVPKHGPRGKPDPPPPSPPRKGEGSHSRRDRHSRLPPPLRGGDGGGGDLSPWR